MAVVNLKDNLIHLPPKKSQLHPRIIPDVVWFKMM